MSRKNKKQTRGISWASLRAEWWAWWLAKAPVLSFGAKFGGLVVLLLYPAGHPVGRAEALFLPEDQRVGVQRHPQPARAGHACQRRLYPLAVLLHSRSAAAATRSSDLAALRGDPCLPVRGRASSRACSSASSRCRCSTSSAS
ncbi:MAG: hypothetical protein WDO13_19265 [Verrucomicrobiota bacterium]